MKKNIIYDLSFFAIYFVTTINIMCASVRESIWYDISFW